MNDPHQPEPRRPYNMLTFEMGKLIRQAREDAGMTQAEVARIIGRRQASLSDMENGKMQPDAATLMHLSLHLRKPVSYFFPIGSTYAPEIEEGVSKEVEELVSNFTSIANKDYRQLALYHMETIMEYDQHQRFEEWRKTQQAREE